MVISIISIYLKLITLTFKDFITGCATKLISLNDLKKQYIDNLNYENKKNLKRKQLNKV